MQTRAFEVFKITLVRQERPRLDSFSARNRLLQADWSCQKHKYQRAGQDFVFFNTYSPLILIQVWNYADGDGEIVIEDAHKQ